MRAAIDYDQSNYEVINLGESRTVELRELISLLEKELDLQAAIIERQPLQPGDVPQTFADISKARRRWATIRKLRLKKESRRFVKWFRTGASQRVTSNEAKKPSLGNLKVRKGGSPARLYEADRRGRRPSDLRFPLEISPPLPAPICSTMQCYPGGQLAAVVSTPWPQRKHHQ